MGFIRWGGKKYYPQKKQPYQPDINELMKPLSEKVGAGNIWGSQIMNVLKEDAVPVSPTPTPTPSVTPTQTPTQTVTPTPSITPTQTVTPTTSVTPTPSITPSPSPIPSGTTEAQAYLSRVVATGGTIDATISAATTTLFTSLVSNGLYDKLNSFYLHIGGTSASHALQSKSTSFPLDYAGGWTFSNSGGTTPNGTNAYGLLKGNINLKATRNNISIGYYSLTDNTSAGNKCDMGLEDYNLANTPTLAVFGYRNNTQNPRLQINVNVDQATNASTNTESDGFYVGSRTGSTKQQMYKNGSIILDGTLTSTAIPEREITIGALHRAGIAFAEYSPRAQAFTFVGQGLSDSEVSTLSTIVNTFQTSLGRNVY